MAITLDQALERMSTRLSPLERIESVSLLHAHDRIASTPIEARFAFPKTALSLKEGYGVCFAHRPYAPLELCMCVSTGSPLSDTIDAVIPYEEASIQNAQLHIPPSLSIQTHIKKQGEDIASEETLVHAYASIGAYHISTLAAQGISHIEVLAPLKVAILSIGNHLRTVGDTLDGNGIYNSNAFGINARICQLGGNVVAIETCEENHKTIVDTCERLALIADMVITTGAMSREDSMCTLLRHTTAFEVLFHEIAICPARPSALSLYNHIPFLHLPGLPLSCLLGFELLGLPLIRFLQHQNPLLPHAYALINHHTLTCKDACVSAIPGNSDGVYFSAAHAYEAGRLAVLGECNGYIRVAENTIVHAGERVWFIPFA